MGLRIIYGRAGTGKSTYCFNEVKNITEKTYIITPEQFSFTAEKNILNQVGSNSVINAEILTFKRMAYRVLTEVRRDYRYPFIIVWQVNACIPYTRRK